MFLHVVGHNQRFRVVHQSFRRSIETIHRHFHQVLFAVGELRSEMIKPSILYCFFLIFVSVYVVIWPMMNNMFSIEVTVPKH
jgi:hypothetical protein